MTISTHVNTRLPFIVIILIVNISIDREKYKVKLRSVVNTRLAADDANNFF